MAVSDTLFMSITGQGSTTDIKRQISLASRKKRAKRKGQRHVTAGVAAEREKALAAWLARRGK